MDTAFRIRVLMVVLSDAKTNPRKNKPGPPERGQQGYEDDDLEKQDEPQMFKEKNRRCLVRLDCRAPAPRTRPPASVASPN